MAFGRALLLVGLGRGLQLILDLVELFLEQFLAVLHGDVAVDLREVGAVALGEEHVAGGGQLLGVVEVQEENLVVVLVHELEAQVALDVHEFGVDLHAVDIGERGLLGAGHGHSFPWVLSRWCESAAGRGGDPAGRRLRCGTSVLRDAPFSTPTLMVFGTRRPGDFSRIRGGARKVGLTWLNTDFPVPPDGWVPPNGCAVRDGRSRRRRPGRPRKMTGPATCGESGWRAVLVPQAGIEPAAPALGEPCSIH